MTDLAEVLTTNKSSETEFDKGFFSKKSAHAAANKSATFQAHISTSPSTCIYLALIVDHWCYRAGITAVVATGLQQP
ncbi:hypothetical protein [Candidatus Thiothrix anitrata]|uniref:Uncharacterized protein n=1 Tax=Candidatus Thiothrix anitrata TaxID=2823902 RepID=A0ABX7WZ41_9GAMM|nr:hypothetical protein [Candidatus Thiothrix anitrata]QTR48892.1 hypothetical protein J8380_11435 [Candidatus Thiothrix anitrata]